MNRRIGQLLAVSVVLGLYYGIQWVTGAVSLAALAGLGPELADADWVASIDHHLVQLALALACIGYLSGGNWRAWGLNRQNLDASKRLLSTGFLPVLVGLLFLGELLVPILTRTPPTFDFPMTPTNVAGTLLFMGIVSGLSEEILFRGFVQTYLSRFFDGTIGLFDHELTAAGLLAALVFTVAHVGFALSPLGLYHFRPTQIALAFVMGIYYAVAYHETESLVAPILAHNLVNGTIATATFLAWWILAG